MPHRWTEAEKQYVWDNAHILTDRVVAARLSVLSGDAVSEEAVRMMRKRVLRIKKAHGRGVCEVVRRPLRGPGVALTIKGS